MPVLYSLMMNTMRIKKKLVILTIFLLVIFSFSWLGLLQAQPADNVKELYRQALSFYQRGQFDNAAQAFARVLEVDPRHKGAAVYLEEKIPCAIAKVEARKRLVQDRELEQASRQYKKQMLKVDAFLNRMEAKQGKQSVIVEKKLNNQLTKQIKAKTNQLYKQARRAYQLKDYKNAAKLFEEVLLLDPGHKQAKAYLQKIPQYDGVGVSGG